MTEQTPTPGPDELVADQSGPDESGPEEVGDAPMRTGVPTVDTLVAQHLIKTVSAARLMGADCIISGIRPQIAQTIVHLGLELDVVSKATMADAFALALRRVGKTVVNRSQPIPGGE